MSKKNVFPAKLKSLHEMLDFVKNCCIKQGFDPTSADKIILATEEAIVNIIHHGYFSKDGLIQITCEDCQNRPGVKINIKDFGVPFDPTEKIQQAKEIKELAEKNLLGGYGIYLYVSIMDQVEYQREGKANSLHMVKYL